MTGHIQSDERVADRVSLGDPAAWPMVGPAAARAGLTMLDHRLQAPAQGATVRLRGEVLLVSCAALGEDVLLMLAELRKRTEVRILLLVAALSTDQRIVALSLGIDHVLTLPLDERELGAILINATRDARLARVRAREHERDFRWALDAERWVLIAPNQREVRLTRAEFGVVQLLLRQAGTVLGRPLLVDAMNGDAGHGNGRTLDVLISRLRRKVWDSARLELPLRSARNAGYLFAGTVGMPAPLDMRA